MGLRDLLPMFPRPERGSAGRGMAWPVIRQLTGDDPTAVGDAARSPTTDRLTPRTDEADEVVGSICPFCAVGCGQRIFVRTARSPTSRVIPTADLPRPAVPARLVNPRDGDGTFRAS
jgi:anaerobic selenocysteine-containing dehydrogenase